ncbi:FAD-dependent monooxygenase, partial [Amycolatopsis sp. NPDC004368]
MNELHAEVVVVGAGPTGLMLGAELRLAGVDAVVVERLPERTGLSKALNLQPRTAEILDLRGLLPRAEDRAFATVQEGQFAAVPVSYAGWDTRHPYQLGIPQAQVEALLEERFAELGGKVLRGHELVGLAQDASGVVVTTSANVSLRCHYLVGCDGGRSTVRRLLDIPFEGEAGTGHGVVADVFVDRVPDNAAGTWTSMRGLVQSSGRTGFRGLIPLDEPLLYRFTFGDRARRPTTFGSPITPPEVHAAFDGTYAPATITKIRWASRFSDAARLAARYRCGRVLLAGDAAHIHFPAGGQGLNLGIQDAMNLGWKLAAALRGFEDVLDTYESERRPVASAVLDNVAAQSALIPRTPATRALRTLFTSLAELPSVSHHLSGVISGLAVRYPAPPGTHPLTGARLPDFRLPTGSWSSTLFHSGHHVLLTTPTANLSALPTIPGPLSTTDLPALPSPTPPPPSSAPTATSPGSPTPDPSPRTRKPRPTNCQPPTRPPQPSPHTPPYHHHSPTQRNSPGRPGGAAPAGFQEAQPPWQGSRGRSPPGRVLRGAAPSRVPGGAALLAGVQGAQPQAGFQGAQPSWWGVQGGEAPPGGGLGVRPPGHAKEARACEDVVEPAERVAEQQR